MLSAYKLTFYCAVSASALTSDIVTESVVVVVTTQVESVFVESHTSSHFSDSQGPQETIQPIITNATIANVVFIPLNIINDVGRVC